MKLVNLVLALFTLSITLFAQENVNKLISPTQNLSAKFPAKTTLKGKYYSMGGALFSTAEYSIVKQADGTLKVNSSSSISKLSATFLPQVVLKSLTVNIVSKNKALLNEIKQTKRKVKKADDRFHFSIHTTEKGIKTKNVKIKERLFDSDNLNIYLQALLLNGVKESIKTKIMLNSVGMDADVKLTLKRRTKLFEDAKAYKLPTDVKQHFNKVGDYYVYKMELTGLLGAIVKAKYYIAFNNDETYSFAAYWGGPENKEEFIYFNEKVVLK